MKNTFMTLIKVDLKSAGCVGLSLALLLVVAGCGGGGGDGKVAGGARADASGKVTYDGKPVPAGSVVFRHKESGTVVECPISDGEYENVSGLGPVIGDNSVGVTGLDKSGEDAKPLWTGPWAKEVKIEASGYKEDLTILATEVKPYVETIDN
jgi:hypothetical protein